MRVTDKSNETGLECASYGGDCDNCAGVLAPAGQPDGLLEARLPAIESGSKLPNSKDFFAATGLLLEGSQSVCGSRS